MQSSFTSKLKAYFLQFDVFGEPPTFRILGQQRYNTTLGTFLTIGIFFFAVGYLVIGVTELLSYEAPSIIQSDRQVVETQPFQLKRENFTIAITMADLNSQPLTTINKYFTMELKNCQTTRYFNETTQTSNVTRNCTVFPLEACTMDHFISQHQIDYFSKIKLGSVQCIKKEFWDQRWPVLQGIKTSSIYQSLTITVAMCQNTTNRTTCAPQEEIEKNLASGFYAVHMSDSLLQLDRPGNISLDYINLQYNTFSKTTSKQLLQQFKMINSNTDSGLIFSDISSNSILIQDSLRESADFYNSQYIVLHNINLSTKYSAYTRSYIKLQVILSRVGGLYQLIFLIITALIRPFVSLMLNIELSNNLFRLHSQKNQQEKEKQFVQNLPDAFAGMYQNKNKASHHRIQSNPEQQNKQIDLLFKKEQSISNDVKQILLLFFGCARQKNEILNTAKLKYMKSLDVKFIIQKFQELDQLKNLLLTDDQKILFNFLPKPLIVEDMGKARCLEYDQQVLQTPSNAVQEALDAYEKVQSSGRQSVLNVRLIQSLDPEIQQLFQYVQKGSQINNQQLLTEIPLNQSKIRFDQPMESSSRFQENASSQQVYISIPKKMQKSQVTK